MQHAGSVPPLADELSSPCLVTQGEDAKPLNKKRICLFAHLLT